MITIPINTFFKQNKVISDEPKSPITTPIKFCPNQFALNKIQPNLSITSFPNQDGMALDQDLLGLVLMHVADLILESISKGFTKLNLQIYRLIFAELEKKKEGLLSLLVKQVILDHPIEKQ